MICKQTKKNAFLLFAVNFQNKVPKTPFYTNKRD